MSDKIKLYAVSVMAINKIAEPTGADDGIVQIEHIPSLVCSDSAENAAKQVREEVFQTWPKEQGWQLQGVHVVPISSTYLDFLRRMLEQDQFAINDEMPGYFNFDESPPDYKPRFTTKGH